MECDGCHFSMQSATEKFTSSSAALDFLQEHGCLLPKYGISCPQCGNTMLFNENKHLWKCCGKLRNPATRKSVRCDFAASRHKGTWLDSTKLPPETTVLFVAAYMNGILSVSYARDKLGMAPNSFADWSNYVREVCLEDLRRRELKIGGDGLYVEIHAELFKGKWVLGGIERGGHKVFFTLIPNRSPKTIAHHIKRNVLPGTTVITIRWKGYRFLGEDPSYKHLTVNHARKFVDPVTGAHIKNIVMEWGEVKRWIPKNGGGIERVDSYLAAYQWMRMFSDRETLLHHFFAVVADIYPPQPPSLS